MHGDENLRFCIEHRNYCTVYGRDRRSVRQKIAYLVHK